jgi:DUF4097 and DUF4098 domain-containing protein YvlB
MQAGRHDQPRERPYGQGMTRTRLLIPIAVLLVLAAVGAGGIAIAAVSLSHTENRSHVLDGTVTRVVVESSSGDLDLQTIAGTQTRVREHRTYFAHKPTLDMTLRDGVLRMKVDCGSFAINCSDDLTVGVPRGVRTTMIELDSGDVKLAGLDGQRFLADTDSGDLEARTIRGDLSLETDSGDATISDVTGTIALRSDSGDVEGRRLRAPDITAASDSGDVALDLLAAPASLQAETDSGDVDVRVPGDS